MFDIPGMTIPFAILPDLRTAYRKYLEEQAARIRDGMKLGLAISAVGFTALAGLTLHLLGSDISILVIEGWVLFSCLLLGLSCFLELCFWGRGYNAFVGQDQQMLEVSADAVSIESEKAEDVQDKQLFTGSFKFQANEWELVYFVACMPSLFFHSRNALLFFRNRATRKFIVLSNSGWKHRFYLLINDFTQSSVKAIMEREYEIKTHAIPDDDELLPYITETSLASLYRDVFRESIKHKNLSDLLQCQS